MFKLTTVVEVPESFMQGAPCNAKVVYSDNRWLVLLRSDEQECVVISLYDVIVDAVWERNGVEYVRIKRTKMKAI